MYVCFHYSLGLSFLPQPQPSEPKFPPNYKPRTVVTALAGTLLSSPKAKFSPSTQTLPSAPNALQFNSNHFTFITSKQPTLPPAYLYQKEKRVLPGQLQSGTFCADMYCVYIIHYLWSRICCACACVRAFVCVWLILRKYVCHSKGNVLSQN